MISLVQRLLSMRAFCGLLVILVFMFERNILLAQEFSAESLGIMQQFDLQSPDRAEPLTSPRFEDWLSQGQDLWRERGLHISPDLFATFGPETEALNNLIDYSRHNHPEALFRLGRTFEGLTSIENNYEQAMALYIQAAETGHLDAQHSAGQLYQHGSMDLRDYQEARKWYLEAAANGSSESMYELGKLHSDGLGGPKDETEARKWYGKSAKAGLPAGQNTYGVYLLEGTGGDRNPVQARRFIEQAAESGDSTAQENLGLLYEQGIGGVQDYATAHGLYKTAIAGGDVLANTKLGRLYERGWGVRQDYAKAAEFYRITASAGDSDAQYNLGRLYEQGLGVALDYGQSFQWYSHSAEQGDSDALYKVGFLYEQGKGVTQDYSKAFQSYQQAASNGVADAKYRLGLMYSGGQGVEINYNAAVASFQDAVEQKHPLAAFELGRMYEEGLGVTKNGAQALAYYQSSAEFGHPEAWSKVGIIYEQGEAVETNFENALSAYETAAYLGYSAAQESYNRLYKELLTDPQGPRFYAIPVYYATDRLDNGEVEPKSKFDDRRDESEKISYGKALVSIPDFHEKGKLENWARIFKDADDPEKEVLFYDFTSLTQESYFKTIQNESALNNTSTFVYVHGYNNSFNDAARRAAQLAYDMELDGPVLIFSWASRNSEGMYPADEDTADWSIDHFAKYLLDLRAVVPAAQIDLLAHSMGNRVLLKAIKDLILADSSTKFDEIILAAPDIEKGKASQLVRKIYPAATRVTLYASDKDRALILSHKFHDYSRAGEAGNDLLVMNHLQTIDATPLGYGHSYVAEIPVVIDDVADVVIRGANPDQRVEALEGLQHKDSGLDFWRFRL